MNDVFEGTQAHLGLRGDRARVTHVDDRVVIRCVDIMAEEVVTIAMDPDQARAFAEAIIASAEMAAAPNQNTKNEGSS